MVEILAITTMACGTTMGTIAIVLRTRHRRLGVGPVDATELVEEISKLRAEVGAELKNEVSKLRAEVSALRSRTAKIVADEVRHRPSIFMDMAEALNHLKPSWPSHDERVLRLPAIELALGKRVRMRLLNGKEAEFTLPAQTRSGTKFRFRGGGEEGRDLHLEVLSNDTEQDGAK